jgi:hypothetical protein
VSVGGGVLGVLLLMVGLKLVVLQHVAGTMRFIPLLSLWWWAVAVVGGGREWIHGGSSGHGKSVRGGCWAFCY